MFIHFGINTFYDEEWTDGSKPAASYKPLSVNADQWIHVAKQAGMKYVILVTKHVDGFCFWDSKYTVREKDIQLVLALRKLILKDNAK